METISNVVQSLNLSLEIDHQWHTLEMLPQEVLEHILKIISNNDLRTLALTSKKMRVKVANYWAERETSHLKSQITRMITFLSHIKETKQKINLRSHQRSLQTFYNEMTFNEESIQGQIEGFGRYLETIRHKCIRTLTSLPDDPLEELNFFAYPIPTIAIAAKASFASQSLSKIYYREKKNDDSQDWKKLRAQFFHYQCETSIPIEFDGRCPAELLAEAKQPWRAVEIAKKIANEDKPYEQMLTFIIYSFCPDKLNRSHWETACAIAKELPEPKRTEMLTALDSSYEQPQHHLLDDPENTPVECACHDKELQTPVDYETIMTMIKQEKFLEAKKLISSLFWNNLDGMVCLVDFIGAFLGKEREEEARFCEDLLPPSDGRTTGLINYLAASKAVAYATAGHYQKAVQSAISATYSKQAIYDEFRSMPLSGMG